MTAKGRRKRRKKAHKHGKGRHRGGHKHHKHKKKRKGQRDTCDVCASGCPYTSIQDAIDDPAGPTTIRLCAETYGGTIDITKDLPLTGAGDEEDGTVLDGQQNGAVVTVLNGDTVTVEGLRITGGSSNGVYIFDGTVTLTNCAVTGNSHEVGGGGIYTPNADSVVTLVNCTVSDNTVGGGGGGFYNPGGSVTLNDTSVTGNAATFGGGMYNAGGTVTLNGTSSVTGNTADGGQLGGGGIYNASGTVTLNDDSSVTENDPDNCAGFGTYTGNACGP